VVGGRQLAFAKCSSMLGRLASRYDGALRSHPLLTKAVTSGVIASLGDACTQKLIENQAFDFARNARFTALGAGLVAPALHVWYGYLGRLIPGTGLVETTKRVALDQFAFSPVFIGLFFTSLGGLERKQPQEIKNQLEEIWVPTIYSNWAWWIPVQIVNFGAVPAAYQVLFANGAGLIWNSYLSYVSQHKKEDV